MAALDVVLAQGDGGGAVGGPPEQFEGVEARGGAGVFVEAFGACERAEEVEGEGALAAGFECAPGVVEDGEGVALAEGVE